MKDTITKLKKVECFQVPEEQWQLIEHHFPTPPAQPDPGRPRASDRATLNGI